MKPPLLTTILAAAITSIALFHFSGKCPFGIREDSDGAVAMEDNAAIIPEPVAAVSDPLVAASPETDPAPVAANEFERIADTIVEGLIQHLAECPGEAHELIATFGDGSTAFLPIPPFNELLATRGGDVDTLREEWRHSVIHALESGAVKFQVIPVETEDDDVAV